MTRPVGLCDIDFNLVHTLICQVGLDELALSERNLTFVFIGSTLVSRLGLDLDALYAAFHCFR